MAFCGNTRKKLLFALPYYFEVTSSNFNNRKVYQDEVFSTTIYRMPEYIMHEYIMLNITNT